MLRDRAMRLLKTIFGPRTILEAVLVVLIIAAWYRPPAGTVSPWRNKIVYAVPTKEKVVALTYDDGPHPQYTPELLNVLDKYHVKATFFMVGERMEQYPDIVEDVVARGHVVANHTYTHPRDMALDTSAQVIQELQRCEEVIERLTGRRAHLFRPPRGLMDGTVFAIAGEEGYRTILWTICADHHDAPKPCQMAERVIQHIRPGAIILAHDGRFAGRWKDVAATPMIIEALKKQDYRFVTIPELLKIGRKVWLRNSAKNGDQGANGD